MKDQEKNKGRWRKREEQEEGRKEEGKQRVGRTGGETGEEKLSLVSALEGNNLLIQRELLY